MVHVPYRGGGPALTDLIGGQVQAMFAGTIASVEYIKTGKLRALGCDHCDSFGGVTGLADRRRFCARLRGESAGSASAHLKTHPPKSLSRLNMEINAALADPKIKTRFAELGATVIPGSPADFGKLIADETEKWGKVVRFAGVKPE